jgi:hypothetical protein
MSLGTQRITSPGYRTVYTVPAGKRATVNAIAYANSETEIALAAQTTPSPTTYTSLVSPLSAITTFTGSTASERMGTSVSIDGSYAAVGCEGTNPSSVGFVKIYFYTGGVWTLQQTITDPNNDVDAFFGCSVCIDGTNLVVGAYGDDTAPSNVGRAYRYSRSGTTWTLAATYTSPSTSGGEQFGRSVSIAGDYIIIGSPGYNSAEGRAYGYRVSTGTTLQVTYSAAATGNFGHSVSVSNNGRAIIGSHTSGGSNVGQAAYYSSWGSSVTAIINSPGATGDGFFGYSVSIDKTGNFAVVGAYNEGSNTIGRAYAYMTTSGGIIRIATFTPPDSGNQSSGFFGHSVAVDSIGNVLIGQYGYDATTSVTNIGRAYFYSYSNRAYTLARTIENPVYGINDNFGFSVSLSSVPAGTTGSNNSYQTTSEFLIGSPGYDVTITNQSGNNDGAAYFYGGNLTTANVQADADAIVPLLRNGTDRITLPANQTFERTGLVLDAGESLVALLPSSAGDVTVQVRGFEENV